jgi:predicted  nucleic acid-binding Zn-ribbon protein
MSSFAYCVIATLCGVAVFSSSGALASPLQQQVAQQNSPVSPQAGAAPAQRELERLQSDLEAANERIKALEDSVALEREVNDRLMRARPTPEDDPALLRKLESVGSEFERVLLELNQFTSR